MAKKNKPQTSGAAAPAAPREPQEGRDRPVAGELATDGAAFAHGCDGAAHTSQHGQPDAQHQR